MNPYDSTVIIFDSRLRLKSPDRPMKNTQGGESYSNYRGGTSIGNTVVEIDGSTFSTPDFVKINNFAPQKQNGGGSKSKTRWSLPKAWAWDGKEKILFKSINAAAVHLGHPVGKSTKDNIFNAGFHRFKDGDAIWLDGTNDPEFVK